MSSSVQGSFWEVEKGEISEQDQFLIRYPGSDTAEAYFPIVQLSDLISILSSTAGASVGVLVPGTYLQARKVDAGYRTDVRIEPRSDTFPAQIMSFGLELLSDLSSTLTTFNTGIADREPEDWDGSEPSVIGYGSLPPALSPPNLNASIGVISGVVDDDATDNLAAIQACLDQGGRWRLPATTGRYLISGPLEVSVAGTTLDAWGAPLRQGVDGQSVFNVTAPDVRLDGVDAIGDLGALDVTGMTASWELSIISSRWTVVNAYKGADRLTIPWIRGNGFSSVVRVTNWDRDAGSASGTVADVEVGTVLCQNVEFGYVVQGVSRPKLGSVRGSYRYPTGGTRPPHLIYFSGTGGENTDIEVGGGVASYEGGAGGQAFQFKGVTRGHVGTLQANGCPGALNLMDNHDLTIDTIVSLSDTNTSDYGSITMDQTVEQKNITIRKVHIQMVSDGIPMRIVAGDNCRVIDLDVEVAHTTSGTSAAHDVSLNGTNHTIDRVRVKNVGAANSWRAVALWGGDGHRVGIDRLENVRVGVEVRLSATNASVTYNPDDITLHATDGYRKIMVSPTAAPTLSLPQQPSSSLVKVADDFRIAPPSGDAFGVAITGQEWTVGLGTWVSDTLSGEVSETGSVSRANSYIDANAANVEIGVKVKLTGYPGVIMRRVAAAEYLCVYLSTAGVVIAKRDTTLVTLQSGPAVTYQTGRWYDLRVQIFGEQIDVYVDNVFSVSHTLAGGDETKFDTETVHGLFSSASEGGASRWRDYRIRQL
jgi:hypothetical protein|tara:strand:- start:9362 stop:11647 length:2286 start_codon:yes stop_codon:yes gene_type:complete